MNGSQFSDVSAIFNEIESIVESVFGIANAGYATAIIAIAVITAIISFIISLAVYVLEALPLSILAKKAGKTSGWIAWIPFFSSFCRLYVLMDICSPKPVTFFSPKFQIKNRPISFWLYLLIRFCGATIISVIIVLVNLVPVVGQIVGAVSSSLYLLPTFAMAVIEYFYLKDVLDLFRTDDKTNKAAAIIVTVLDRMVTFGLARSIYLYTITKNKPIPSSDVVVDI